MPADEVTTGSDVDAARVRTGPRHAAPKKPLFTRFHMPAGKAIALAAMPTAVLMGMGFTPTLANAEDQPASKSLTIDEYKDCVAALEDEDASASASPSPSASESTSDSTDDAKDDAKDDSTSTDGSQDDSKDTSGDSGDSSSSDSGSDEGAEPAPSASSEAASTGDKSSTSSGDTATASPSASATDKNVLETIGDAITDLFDGDKSDATASASPSPSASASASTGSDDSSSDADAGAGSGSSGGSDASDSGKGTVKDTTDALTDAVKDTAEDTADTAEKTAEDAEKAAADATASPSASESATDADDCPVATDDESGIDNKVPLADDPWYLNASSLLLKGADYQGIVEVKTANGTKKKVLKYVISDGTDIGDLHQTVNDKQAGKTYHVQAGSGTTSTIRNGQTIMYTESISGNLFGLIPITFSPENPPPLNIPLIYFTKVKVVQAGQFGGDLHIPGMHLYSD